ncbi:hypothetical protein M885DRAFT_280486 [Pelagophyceae sp. CCMP2097]|nr:hypothetical protein M885DRAFT_280486 [Pelagophyceae sp. CCMP2097]
MPPHSRRLGPGRVGPGAGRSLVLITATVAWVIVAATTVVVWHAGAQTQQRPHSAATNEAGLEPAAAAEEAPVSPRVRTPSTATPLANRSGGVTPLHSSASHGLPFVIYDVFASERHGCGMATFVAQLEGGCGHSESVLEAAGIDDWAGWRAELRRSHPTCPRCVASKWRSRVKRAVLAAADALYARRAPKGRGKLPLYCEFADSRSGLRSVVAAEGGGVDGAWLRQKSTAVFECRVPPELRAAVCAGARVDVRVSAAPAFANAHPPLPVLLQRRIGGAVLGACAWVSGGSYADREGDAQALPAARVAEWIAQQTRLGVEHFGIFDNSAGVFAAARRAERGEPPAARALEASPLEAALRPLVERGRLTHVAWPHADEVDEERSCSPQSLESRVATATNSTVAHMTTQGFFGRPAQYAAQNSCHRRLVAAGLNWVTHNDVDEFIAPPYTAETAPLKALLRREELRAKVPAALAMPCIFYAPCRPAAARGGLLLDGVDCAGKVQMYRQKLVAHKSALYLWVHYVRIAAPGAVTRAQRPPSAVDAALDCEPLTPPLTARVGRHPESAAVGDAPRARANRLRARKRAVGARHRLAHPVRGRVRGLRRRRGTAPPRRAPLPSSF